MTPDQISSIISAMPEGKRKIACLMVAHLYIPGGFHAFWQHIEAGAYGKAASELLGLMPDMHGTDMLADMIWEGGA